MTWFSPWNSSDDIPVDNTVNTKAFANFNNPFLFLERRLSSWHHEGQEGGSSQQPLGLSQAAEPVLAQLYLPGQAVAVPRARGSSVPLLSALWEAAFSLSWSLCCQGSAAELSWAGQVSCLQVPSWSLEEPSWVCALPAPVWGLLMAFTGVPLVRGCWQTLPQKEQ